MTEDASRGNDFRNRIRCEKNIKPGPKNVKSADNKKQQERKNLLKFYEICGMRIEEREGDFNSAKRKVEQVLEQMLRDGEIGSNTKLLSRIKSFESIVSKLLLLINADKASRMSDSSDIHLHKNERKVIKANDIFGVAILTETEKELELIEEKLQKVSGVSVTSVRHRNEKRTQGAEGAKTGYKATHMEFLVGDREPRTIIELHMQTFDSYKNCYPHEYYKMARKLNKGESEGQKRNLTPEEEQEIREIRQKEYEEGKLEGITLPNGRKSRIPEMYESNFNEEGKMIETKWDLERILQELYPFLDMGKGINRWEI